MTQTTLEWMPVEVKAPEGVKTVTLDTHGRTMFWDDGKDGWPADTGWYVALPRMPWNIP